MSVEEAPAAAEAAPAEGGAKGGGEGAPAAPSADDAPPAEGGQAGTDEAGAAEDKAGDAASVGEGEAATEGAPVAAAEETAAATAPTGDGAGDAAAPAADGEGGVAGAPAGEEGAEDLEKPDFDAPLPKDYVELEDGKKAPLPGVESLFCTQSTLALVGLEDMGDPAEGQTRTLIKYIEKEVLLKDIQFRGSISDFHYMKKMIDAADYSPLLIRYNDDDLYGDGNNFELFHKQSAVEVYESIAAEQERRRKWLEAEAAREAAQKALPKSKRVMKLGIWKSLGSEVEIEEASVVPTREPIAMTVQRPRREFNQDYKFADKDSHELWNSAQMECRPFKDPNFDLKRAEMDTSVQAAPATCEAGVQATAGPPRPGSTQCEPRVMSPEEQKAAMASEEVRAFLAIVGPRLDEALQQNEITNVYEDDFVTLAEEDGMSGNKKENVISEHQSFTDLTYSKNKVVQAIQWVPGAKGTVAVACTEPLSFTERVQTAGRTSNSAILIWNFKDPIHPEYVLESPFEVTSFQFNPLNHKIITAGLFNGRAVYWDTGNDATRTVAAKAAKKDDGKEEETTVEVFRSAYISAPDTSHKARVTDLTWLPGIEVTRDGKVLDLASEEARGRDIDPKDNVAEGCHFFVTTAADGAIMFWDIRVRNSRKRGQRETEDIAWSPLYTVPLLDTNGRDLASIKFSFKLATPTATEMLVGSADGEIVYADWCKPDGVDHPDYSKFCVDGHSGPIVSVERSPFFADYILTVGDWCFNLWKEGLQTAIFTSPYASNYLTSGCWSPTRPGVLYIAKQDGELDVWDMLDRSHEPAITSTISSTPIVCVSINMRVTNAAQQMLAVGDSVGVLHIMELPRNLRRPVANEKALMLGFLQREERRVAFSVEELAPARQARAKEIEAAAAAVKDTKDAEVAKAGKAAKKETSAADKLEAEYEKLEHEFKIELGLIAAEE